MEFVLGAWRNRRYTRLPSSLILGALPGALFLTLVASSSPGTDLLAFLFIVPFLALQAVAYPLARETWFRVTQPLREGIGEWTLPLPVALIFFGVRFQVYLVVWSLAIPMGAIGFAHLARGERAGRGWRLP